MARAISNQRDHHRHYRCTQISRPEMNNDRGKLATPIQQSFTSCRDYSFRLLLFFYFRCLRPFRAYDTTRNIKFLRRSYLNGGRRVSLMHPYVY